MARYEHLFCKTRFDDVKDDCRFDRMDDMRCVGANMAYKLSSRRLIRRTI